ncbi:hypothetical protein D805_0199 [Bifidobacterium thermophilum RBL67]|uniref:Uncharacterized protein n=1 Tax=Bifidobacterium thermophilum RBL67 TaxID=1254439 RepID=M4RAJ0_9BIFI|nr:hypothetical protein D805_0199 [Bifidobacterium thermophilum RBL67]
MNENDIRIREVGTGCYRRRMMAMPPARFVAHGGIITL